MDNDISTLTDRELLEAIYTDIHAIKVIAADVAEAAKPAMAQIEPMLKSPMVKLAIKGLIK